MVYSPIYYIQTNVICLFLLAVLYGIEKGHTKISTIENQYLERYTLMAGLYCVTDLGSWLVNGGANIVTRIVAILINIIYIAIPVWLSLEWLGYVFFRTNGVVFAKTKVGRIIHIPFIVLIGLIISSPVTHFAFTLDENNVYHRHFGIYVGPAVGGLVILFTLGWIIRFMRSAEHRSMREEIMPVLFFPIPIAVTSILQIAFYGVSVSQVGFVISIMMLFLHLQMEKISIDELTGLNNRRELKMYLNTVLGSSNTVTVFLCMIDVDYFKHINDTYGHLEGDRALKLVADTMKNVASKHSRRLFLARYGGDEFVIAGRNRSENSVKRVRMEMLDALAQAVKDAELPYSLTMSIGYTFGGAEDFATKEDLLKQADERMYEIKQARDGKDADRR